jgi:hypothetical protein
MDLAAVLAWAAARAAHWLARVFRSIGCRCNAWIGRQFSGVVRGRRRALRRTGPRPPALCFGVPNQARALRVELAPPVRRIAPTSLRSARCCAPPRNGEVDDPPDASLEVLVPCSARLPRRVFVCREAPPLRPSRFDRWPASSVLLRPGVRVRSRAMDRSIRSHRASRATPCTHAPALTLAVPAVFRLAEMARSNLRGSTPRVLAGTLRRSRRAPLHRTHAEPTTGHAPARSWSAGVPLPAVGVTWPGRAPFRRREACLGFRPVNLAGNEAGLSSRV